MTAPKLHNKRIRSLTIDELNDELAYWRRELLTGETDVSDDTIIDMIGMLEFNLAELREIEREQTDDQT